MKIRIPGRLTGIQLGLATVLGVLGGIYIWKPLLIQYKESEITRNSDSERKNLKIIQILYLGWNKVSG